MYLAGCGKVTLIQGEWWTNMILKKGCMNIKRVTWNWLLCFSLERDFIFFLSLSAMEYVEQYNINKVPCGHVYSPTDCNISLCCSFILVEWSGQKNAFLCCTILFLRWIVKRDSSSFLVGIWFFNNNRYFEGFYIILFSLLSFFNLVFSLMCPQQAKHYWDFYQFYVTPIVNFWFICFLFFQLTEKKWMILVLSVLRRLSGPLMDNVDIVKSVPLALLVSGSFVMIAVAAFASLNPVLFLSPRLELWCQSYFACYKIICQRSFRPNYFVGMEKVMVLVAGNFNIVWCHVNRCTGMNVIFD